MKCSVCLLNKNKSRQINQFKSTTTAKSFIIDTFIACTSLYLLYLIICPCDLQYVGCTTRAMNVRINKQADNIRQGFPKHIVSRHYLECHNKDPAGTSFVAINRITPNWRGSFVRREISRLKTRWIHEMKCYAPHGLNVDWDVNCSIN